MVIFSIAEKSQITTRKRKNISEAAHAAPKDVEPVNNNIYIFINNS